MRQQLGRFLVAEIPAVAREYAQTGEMPKNDLHAAYIRLMESAKKVMDCTVGGDGYEQAQAEHRERSADFQEILKSYGVP